MIELYPFQEKFVNELAEMLGSGKRRIIGQSITGSGKTVCFSGISRRFIERNNSSVLILVHRKELLKQARKTLYEGFNIPSQSIVAGMKGIPPAPVYVGMIESVMRRLPKIDNVGLVIIDECHIANFNKIIPKFPDQYIIGFTATPLSSNKRKPLKMFYEDIVCGPQVKELISMNRLSQNITYAPRDVVERATLTIKNGEFDDSVMAAEYSKVKYVKNTVEVYEKWAKGTKTMVFNVNIDHSKMVNNAFIAAGYNSRHLDSTMTATERENILKWYKNTPNAILNNVGILTAGYDEKTIETVIINKATTSLPLWLQMTGRGSRVLPTKSMFTIIDMGGNAMTHGDWCEDHDWYNIFHHPAKVKPKEGSAPVKTCPACLAIIPAQCLRCPNCGFEFPKKEAAIEDELGDFVVVTKGIDVKKIISQNSYRKEYYAFFKLGKDLAARAKKTIPVMNDEIAEYILTKYYDLAHTWCKEQGRRFNQWHRDRAKETLFEELSKKYKKWDNPLVVQEKIPDTNPPAEFFMPSIENIGQLETIS